ncbi:hypothetical protein DPMN_013020 [Dreissena polymorpha]|uniref:J domain-containing protein n=1 Tax=Dreissena polymorpha TaxID=45954 RepID=A0A9D4S3A0_DREPO|nr:hypothetical protein DPMN_013020 [Dreissena polymorpha]
MAENNDANTTSSSSVDGAKPEIAEKDEVFDEFYTEVLQCDPDTPMADLKKKFRQMSLLVHPDKNPDDKDRSQVAFEAVNKAYKTLQNEEGMKRCREIIDEAKIRVDEMIKVQRKKLKKEGKPTIVPEDDIEKYKHAVYVQTCKLFADLERLRIEKETKDMHERKRKAEEEETEKEKEQVQKEWNKNFEESRTGRVDSWRQFSSQKKSHKKMKGTFRPPKPKLEKR